MQLSWARRNLKLTEAAKLRSLLRENGGDDPATFGILLKKYQSQLSPAECVHAAAVLNGICTRERNTLELPINFADVQAMLSSNIRGKLYALTEPSELCEVTIGAFNHAVASKGLVTDFVGRLEPLFPRVRGQALSQVCDTLVYLHLAGYRTVPVCSKLFAHIAARGSHSDLTPSNYVALVRCMAKTGVRNDSLCARVGHGLRSVLTLPGRISPEDAGELLQWYSSDMFDSIFIRHRLIDAVLSAGDVTMEALARCTLAGVFPTRNIDRIDALVIEGCANLETKTTLRLLSGYAALRYKPPEVIERLLETLKADVKKMRNFSDVASCIYSIYLLDTKERTLIDFSMSFLKNDQAPLSAKDLSDIVKVLGALLHFRTKDVEAYNRLLRETMRLDCSLTHGELNRLQLVSIGLWKLMPELFNSFDVGAQEYLVEIAHRTSPEPLEMRDCDFQKEVSKTVTFVSYTLYKEVQVGPMLVDFVRPVGEEEVADLRNRDIRRPRIRELHEERMLAGQLINCATILIADGRDQFYRNSRERTADSKMKLDVLRGLGFRYLCVPYWEWEPLPGWNDKRRYMENLLSLPKG
ncbi:uncharacterized protein BXIN_0617 [Babesia sp. Xinjiang]|uniref:uncharacterized protein n=1 Tax=Babesia sp. Xinjiang TaxID=462227 RepID=UPI000A221872|nr:uncharacterized protein BXIN_0617 [Babesia sp. Xinjiang]ORM41793.1 hypothetical protein BXIN_0617 [Babesia sp. Xinjiang]